MVSLKFSNHIQLFIGCNIIHLQRKIKKSLSYKHIKQDLSFKLKRITKSITNFKMFNQK